MAWPDSFEKAYLRWRRFVPARLLYHPRHFEILALERRFAARPQERAAWVDAKLRALLTGALRHVPHYRDMVKLSEAELARAPAMELLQRFPVLEKAEVMAAQNRFLDERFKSPLMHYATSGGSSGEGIGLWRNKRLADIERAFFTFHWAPAGFSFDKARLLRIGADARAQAHEPPCRVVGNRLMLSPYHVNARHRDAIVAALRAFRPQCMHAYPSLAAALAELLQGMRPEDCGLDALRGVVLASEPATAAQLATTHAAFGMPIIVNYGLTERTNIAFARYEPGRPLRYSFDALYGVSENRDWQGQPEIVGTSLWNDVMPLIRYATRDFGRIDAHGVCERLEGRAQEFLVDRNGAKLPGLSIVIDEVTWDFVRLYQVQQERPGAIRIAVVPRQAPLSDAQRAFVLDAQIKRWGSFFAVELVEVDDIPPAANGKRKLVVSQVQA
ncbi:AMP-binding protein [Roseateles sp.]|uniref:AMP-binding protein n=1 Tax=Roseateles sp. TaxID=1971397 RepID=UPI0025FCE903|nr:AMP-binding protein [Roseateles sp.]MBV8033898.1 hypothetical protein [Roseateles sp.]